MTEFDLTIRNGLMVTAAETMRADIGVVGERIVALAETLPPGRRDIDAAGLPVLPGGVDTHVHVEQLGSPQGDETFATASLSALHGGTTTIITHARQAPGSSLLQCVEDYAVQARASVADYAFHLLVTEVTDDLLEHELPALVAAGHSSVKVFMATRANALDDKALLRLMAKCRDLGVLVLVHAENMAAMDYLTEILVAEGQTELECNHLAKPAAIEREAIHRILTYAELLGAHVHVFHVTSAEAVEEIARAQARGVVASGETCPQYLVFTDDDLRAKHNQESLAKLIFGPPPRRAADQEALWSALATGTIDVVSSDHSPHPLGGADGKIAGARKGGFPTTPNGIPGLETRLSLLFSTGVATGRLSYSQFVALTATKPARRFGLYPRKGTLAIGSDADILVWDPDRVFTVANAALHHGVDYTPYEGFKLRGQPSVVISRGEVLIENGAARVAPSRGRFLVRSPAPSAIPSTIGN